MTSKLKYLSLRAFLWKTRFSYRPEPKTIDLKWAKVITYGVITVPIKSLRPSICTKNGNVRVPLEKTPHYQWIKDLVDGKDDVVSKEDYRKYLETFCSNETYFPWSTDEKLNHVIEIVSSYQSDPEKCKAITIITGRPKWTFETYSYIVKIYDGLHRASVAMATGQKVIQCRVK